MTIVMTLASWDMLIKWIPYIYRGKFIYDVYSRYIWRTTSSHCICRYTLRLVCTHSFYGEKYFHQLQKLGVCQ